MLILNWYIFYTTNKRVYKVALRTLPPRYSSAFCSASGCCCFSFPFIYTLYGFFIHHPTHILKITITACLITSKAVICPNSASLIASQPDACTPVITITKTIAITPSTIRARFTPAHLRFLRRAFSEVLC